MIIKYSPLGSLPRLAWGARIDKGAGYVSVFHGKGVETTPAGFIEGAWNGQFVSFDVINSTIICGTGAVLAGESIRFFSSTDRLSPIFSIVLAESIFVSNSPVFALSMAELEPHKTYPFYTYDLLRTWREGLYCLSGKLKTDSAESLRVHFSAIMTVNTQRSISFDTHALCAAPEDYTSYQAKLLDGVKQIFENAGDPQRKHSYKPLAAISKGYDSTATAVLASQAGCTEAVTYFDSRHPEPYSDSGRENASRLGMGCTEYDRWTYLKMTDLAEAEFGLYATAVSTPMLAMETQLAGRILVSGHFGDTIWGKEKSSVCDNLSLTWANHISGLSQIEFRLRVGYLAFAPAYIGARHNRKTHRIAISDEMQPWSIPGDYDRPIPRRMAEEASLPSNSFGMQKKASSHAHFIFEKNFSKKTWAHYRNFVKLSVKGKQRLPCLVWRALAWSQHFVWKVMNLIHGQGVSKSSKIKRAFPYILHKCPILVPWPYMLTFQWSFSLLKNRYDLPKNE